MRHYPGAIRHGGRTRSTFSGAHSFAGNRQNIWSQLLPPAAGRVYWHQTPIAEAEINVSIVFQSFAFCPGSRFFKTSKPRCLARGRECRIVQSLDEGQPRKASAGAWNAPVFAESSHVADRTLQTIGLGAQIDAATDSGRFPILLLATMLISLMVATMNRLVWRRLYRLAETRYKLEG